MVAKMRVRFLRDRILLHVDCRRFVAVNNDVQPGSPAFADLFEAIRKFVTNHAGTLFSQVTMLVNEHEHDNEMFVW